MNDRRLLFILIGLLCIFRSTMGQNAMTIPNGIIYSQNSTIQHIGRFKNTIIYSKNGNIFNFSGAVIASESQITGLSVDPTGSYFAYINVNEDGESVSLQSLWNNDFEPFELIPPTQKIYDILFSGEGLLYVLKPEGSLCKFLLENNEKQMPVISSKEMFSLPLAANKLYGESETDYLAAVNGYEITIWNKKSCQNEVVLNFNEAIIDVLFSSDSKRMVILTKGGACFVYDTDTFMRTSSLLNLGTVQSACLTPDNKYLAFASNKDTISFQNLRKEEERYTLVVNNHGPIDYLSFFDDVEEKTYVAYHSGTYFSFEMFDFLPSNLNGLIEGKVKTLISDWENLRPGESLYEYQARVNDVTREEQKQLYFDQLLGEMASELLETSSISFGSYNYQSNILSLEMDKLDDIHIYVPLDQVGYFTEISELQFNNTRYGLDDGSFFILYTEITNSRNGIVYTYDKESIGSYDEDSDMELPLSSLQAVFSESRLLGEISENIIRDARNNKGLSSHSIIKSVSQIVEGEQELDYSLKVQYSIDNDFRAVDDFVSGSYKLSDSKAASAVLSIAEKSLNKDFGDYLQPNKRVIINIFSSADASENILDRSHYDGCFGNLENVSVVVSGYEQDISVESGSGYISNEQLAFLRAVGIKEQLENCVPKLKEIDVEYNYFVTLTGYAGTEENMNGIEITFLNAFK